ncbi:hypothetical protein IWX90DRAFT_8472 [Phyllosticta citrichinensis]|uniref:Uncharacterized protein n=1 Tax=Phyllosticta citrichinensis TaxID=1130410 RepID=A0ABR1Y5T9_9PEZI
MSPPKQCVNGCGPAPHSPSDSPLTNGVNGHDEDRFQFHDMQEELLAMRQSNTPGRTSPSTPGRPRTPSNSSPSNGVNGHNGDRFEFRDLHEALRAMRQSNSPGPNSPSTPRQSRPLTPLQTQTQAASPLSRARARFRKQLEDRCEGLCQDLAFLQEELRKARKNLVDAYKMLDDMDDDDRFLEGQPHFIAVHNRLVLACSRLEDMQPRLRNDIRVKEERLAVATRDLECFETHTPGERFDDGTDQDELSVEGSEEAVDETLRDFFTGPRSECIPSSTPTLILISSRSPALSARPAVSEFTRKEARALAQRQATN